MRTTLIAGNWKMNKNVDESLQFAKDLINMYNTKKNIEVLICPPYTALYSLGKKFKGSGIKLGAQNMFYEESGAYTGEISPDMIKNCGAEYVIIGHSERRKYFGETDEIINKKLISALKYNILPILCVGENLSQREKGQEKNIVRKQLIEGYKNISYADASKITVAYEPVWAIGTGKNASSDQACEMASFIRTTISEIYDYEISEKMLILYGGSVKGENAAELLGKKDIDGALVGGASLKADEFIKIINSGSKKTGDQL